jgi:glyoxylase-like metal-dependent hydrolase (beta-lactamase superfamily II)
MAARGRLADALGIATLAAIVLTADVGEWGGATLRAQNQTTTTRVAGGLDVVHVRPNVYMIAGAGAHISVQIGPDGVIVIDSGLPAKADEVVAAIRTLTDQPIRYVINTSAGLDHVGGNEKLARAGQTLFNIENNLARTRMTSGSASIVSTEKVLLRMSSASTPGAPFPSAALPTEPFFQARKVLFFNGEGIELVSQPAAHSDGDLMVLFRRSDVVVAGEVLDTAQFPVIDLASGGSVQGEINALNKLMELAIPSVPFPWRDDGTVVIPARGRICDQIDIADYRDMVTIVRDRVRQLITEGKSLAEVQRASPTQGFTRRYGSDSGPWTTAMFVEAVYASLTGAAK